MSDFSSRYQTLLLLLEGQREALLCGDVDRQNGAISQIDHCTRELESQGRSLAGLDPDQGALLASLITEIQKSIDSNMRLLEKERSALHQQRSHLQAARRFTQELKNTASRSPVLINHTA